MTERVRLFMPHIKTKRDLAEVNNNNNNNSNVNKAKCSDAHRLLRRGSRGRVTTGGVVVHLPRKQKVNAQ